MGFNWPVFGVRMHKKSPNELSDNNKFVLLEALIQLIAQSPLSGPFTACMATEPLGPLTISSIAGCINLLD